MLLFSLEHQPIFVASPLKPHQNIASLEALAVEGNFDFVAFPKLGVVVSFIPDFHCSRAILTLWDFPAKLAYS